MSTPDGQESKEASRTILIAMKALGTGVAFSLALSLALCGIIVSVYSHMKNDSSGH
jgi:hypothetical protein